LPIFACVATKENVEPDIIKAIYETKVNTINFFNYKSIFTNIPAWKKRNCIFKDWWLKIHYAVEERSWEIKLSKILMLSVSYWPRNKEEKYAHNLKCEREY